MRDTHSILAKLVIIHSYSSHINQNSIISEFEGETCSSPSARMWSEQRNYPIPVHFSIDVSKLCIVTHGSSPGESVTNTCTR